MKRWYFALFVLVLALLSSCSHGQRGGIAIVGYEERASRNGEEAPGLPLEQDRYPYFIPDPVLGGPQLVVVDKETGEYLRNVSFSVADSGVAELQPYGPGYEHIQIVNAKQLGETTVTAVDNDSGRSDDATIAVYRGYHLKANSGVKLSTGQKTYMQSEADVYINSSRSAIEMPGGWFLVTDWIETGILMTDAFAQLTGTLDQVGPPGSITGSDNISTMRLYLIKSRDGGLYAAIMNVADIAFREIIPPPEPGS